MINNNLISLKEYNNIHIYLRKVGLKLGYIYKFLEEGISYNEIECLNLVQIFRKYLNWLDNDIRDTWTIKEEIRNYRNFGFTSRAANEYVKELKKVYKKDSTINWVFRIAESKVNKDSEKIFKDYLKRFNPNNTLNRNSNIKNKCDKCLKEDFDCEKCKKCAMVCCKSCIGMNDDKCQVCIWFDSLAE